MSVKEDVFDLICETLDVKKEEIKEGQKLYDSLGVDSTEMVELVVSLNKKFEIKLETNEVTKFSTPEEVVSAVENKKSA